MQKALIVFLFSPGHVERRNGIYFRRFLSGTVWMALALVSVNYNDVAGCHLSSQKLHTLRLFYLCLNYELTANMCVRGSPAKFIIAILHATERRAESRTPSTINRFDISQRGNNELAGVDGIRRWKIEMLKKVSLRRSSEKRPFDMLIRWFITIGAQRQKNFQLIIMLAIYIRRRRRPEFFHQKKHILAIFFWRMKYSFSLGRFSNECMTECSG